MKKITKEQIIIAKDKDVKKVFDKIHVSRKEFAVDIKAINEFENDKNKIMHDEKTAKRHLK